MTVLGRSLNLFGSPNTLGNITNFTQGLIGGGGYQMQMSFANDGTRFIHTDVAYVGKWNPATGKWFPIVTSPGFDATGAKWATLSAGCHGIAVCPTDSSRVYAILGNTVYQSYGGNNLPFAGQVIYRSDDGGTTWAATSMTTFQGGDSNGTAQRISSPKMYVDPANKDICYASNATGIFFVTYNGGVTWHRPTALLGMWPHATATNNVVPGASNPTVTFTATPAAVLAWNSNQASQTLYGYNLGGGGGPDGLGPFSLGVNGLFYDNGGVGSASFGFQHCLPRDGTPTGVTGILIGDEIYMGVGGVVIIDDSNGTVTNPGIALGDPGATGVASKNVFFAALHSAFAGGALWFTNDGNPEHASAMTGGPTGSGSLKVSNDKAHVGGGNCIYATGNATTVGSQNCWRYVGSAAPGGSSLAPNTWTNIALTSGGGSQVCAPDPTTAGKVACVSGDFQGKVGLSTDYGNTTSGQNTPTFTSPAGQPGWITNGEDVAIATSDAFFDPTNSGHLIWLSGIAVYDCVPAAGFGSITQNNVTAGIESLVIQKIIKAPSPNGKILVACQDRPAFVLSDAHTYPTTAHPVTGNILQAGDIVYADDDPTVVYCGYASNVDRSQDSGATWITIGGIRGLQNGGIASFGIFANSGSGYTNGVYTNVPLTGGTGSGATADITVSTFIDGGGATVHGVTGIVVNQPGDLYAVGDAISANSSDIGGTGSGFVWGVALTLPFKTTNSSNVVTVTSPSHGFTTGRTVGISRFTPFNNINLEGLIGTITVTDSNHYTMVAGTTANATGFGGRSFSFQSIAEGLNGFIPPTDTQTGGSPNLGAPDKLSVIHSDISAFSNLQVGFPTGDPNVVANWTWQNCLANGSTFTGAGSQDYYVDIKWIDTDGAGNTYWFDGGGFIYKSTDKGRTFSKTASTGGFGNNLYSRLCCIRGKPGQLLLAPGSNYGANTFGPLLYSTDSGVTWSQVSNTFYIWCCATGKAKSGGFPAVYIAGQLTNGGEPGVFRCDDFDGARTWIRLDNIRKATLQAPQWVSGDPDVWGHVMVACGQAGFVDGTIS